MKITDEQIWDIAKTKYYEKYQYEIQESFVEGFKHAMSLLKPEIEECIDETSRCTANTIDCYVVEYLDSCDESLEKDIMEARREMKEKYL